MTHLNAAMNNNPPCVFIYTALECEAKPLVNFFKLKKESNTLPFSMYRNNDMLLVVTGVGKTAMAAGIAYSMALFNESKLPVLINIGIAGHKTFEIGSLCLAMKIRDADSGKNFYPRYLGASRFQMIQVETISTPCSQYKASYLSEMEASAFYEVAIRFSSSELIQCLKVVSDNQHSSIDNIQPKLVSRWIDQHVIEIECLKNYLAELRLIAVPEECQEYDRIVKKWHFSVTGKVKLKSLLNRWRLLSSVSWLEKNGMQIERGNDLLKQLESDLEDLEIHL